MHRHTIPFLGEKHKEREEMGREREAQGLRMLHTASPTTWPSFAPINLKVERFWARKCTELKRAAGKGWRCLTLLQQTASLPERQRARGFAAHGCNNQQTSSSGGLIPAPAQGHDVFFFRPSLLKPQYLVHTRARSLNACLKEFHVGK